MKKIAVDTAARSRLRERKLHCSDTVCRKVPASASIIRQVPLLLYGILPASVAPLQQLRCSLAPTRTAKRISSPVFCHDTPLPAHKGQPYNDCLQIPRNVLIIKYL